MEREEVLLESEIFKNISGSLTIEEIIRLLAAYGRKSIDYPIRRYDPIDKIVYFLPGINVNTLRVYELIKRYGVKQAFFEAVKEGENKSVEILINMGVNVNATDMFGRTALMFAAKKGNDAIVSILLNRGANVNARTENGLTALFEAIRKGHPSTVLLLLERGADINEVDVNGWTPLMVAAFFGNSSAVSILLNRGSDINAVDFLGRSALAFAELRGFNLIAESLKEAETLKEAAALKEAEVAN